VIYDEYGGRGLATQLVRGTLDRMRAQGRPILPLCPVVKGFIAKHPDYLDLVPEDRLGEVGLA